MRPLLLALAAITGLLLTSCAHAPHTGSELLNVSYDPTRELYQEYNAAFARHWQQTHGETVSIKMSHGGSGKQARSVIDGVDADVVTLGISSDVDAIQKTGLIAPNWQARLPNSSAPYTSTVVFLVRKGNPKNLHDWPDLIRPDVKVITPSPKTSSGGRWSYLAAYGAALKRGGGDQAARAYIAALYKNVPVLDAGARGSTTTFVQRGIGDVLLAWENEAELAVNKLGHGQFEIVRPSLSILAEPPVCLVDKNVDKHHTRALATEYLNYLYSPEGQKIAARNYYRPRDAAALYQFAAQFPPISLFTVESVFGSVAAAQKTHFADGGLFDQIYTRH